MIFLKLVNRNSKRLSKLVANEEQARLEMHYDFNHDDIMKEIDSYSTL